MPAFVKHKFQKYLTQNKGATLVTKDFFFLTKGHNSATNSQIWPVFKLIEILPLFIIYKFWKKIMKNRATE